jgi:hypothetical protein
LFSYLFLENFLWPSKMSFINAEGATGGRSAAALQATITLAPEPGTLVLLAGALFGLIAYAWRKRRKYSGQ